MNDQKHFYWIFSTQAPETGKQNLYFATKRPPRWEARFLIGIAMCFTILMIESNRELQQLNLFLFDFSSSGSVAPDAKTNAKDLPTLLDSRFPASPAAWVERSSFVRWRMSPMSSCAHVLEQPPGIGDDQTEYIPKSLWNRPTCHPGGKWPCMIAGGITTAFCFAPTPTDFYSRWE